MVISLIFKQNHQLVSWLKNESATEKKRNVFTWVYCLSLLFPYLGCANCHGFGEKSNVVQPLSLLPSQYGIALLILLMNEQPILLFRVHVQHDSAIIRTFRPFFFLLSVPLSLFISLFVRIPLTHKGTKHNQDERKKNVKWNERIYTQKKAAAKGTHFAI